MHNNKMTFKGSFTSVEAVLQTFPNGGGKGDWVVLQEMDGSKVIYTGFAWSDTNERWEESTSKKETVSTPVKDTSEALGKFIIMLIAGTFLAIPLSLSLLWVDQQNEVTRDLTRSIDNYTNALTVYSR